MRQETLERFNKFVKKLKNGCWEWQGNLHKDGYGFFTFGSRQELAHRVAFKLFIGKLPTKMMVCHSCDYPACVNPMHLWLGTQSDNMKDMVLKKRNGGFTKNPLRGEKHSNAKFTKKDIENIRKKAKKGISNSSLATQFGTNYKYIWKIINGLVWKTQSMMS